LEQHGARLRHEPDQQGLRVQQPERQDDVRMREFVRNVTEVKSHVLRLTRCHDLPTFSAFTSDLSDVRRRRTRGRALLSAMLEAAGPWTARRLFFVSRIAAEARYQRR